MDEKLTGEDMGSYAYNKLCRYMCYAYRKRLNTPAREMFIRQRKFHKNLFAPIVCPLTDEEDLVIEMHYALYLSPPIRPSLNHNSKWTFQSARYPPPKTK
jgi:hypothetical protein